MKIFVDGKEVVPDENNIIRVPENAKTLQYVLKSTGSISNIASGETIISNCNGYYSSKTGWHKKEQMENKKLIPLSDFVLEQQWNKNGSPKCDISERSESWQLIVNYAKFLKQPLKMEMFTGENKLFEGYLKTTGGYFDANGSGQSILIDGIDFPIRLDESKTIESLVEYGLTLTFFALHQINN